MIEDNKLKSIIGKYNKMVCVDTEIKATIEALREENQSIMGGIRQGARCLAYPTAPHPPHESPCRFPSYTE